MSLAERNARQFPRIKIMIFSLCCSTGQVQLSENIMKHKKKQANAAPLQKRRQSKEPSCDMTQMLALHDRKCPIQSLICDGTNGKKKTTYKIS